MSNIASVNILDEPIPASFRSPTMVPTRGRFVMQKLRQFNDWITSYIPELIKRMVSDKLRTLKETISKIFSDNDKTPREIETALNGTTRTFRIKGGSTDYRVFLQSIVSPTTTLLEPLKVMLTMKCQFRKMENGEEIFTDYHFNTKNNVVDESTNLVDFLSVSVERLIELIESIQGKGSGWIFDKVLHFDILVNVYKPLGGSSYIPLPKFLANKKAIINPKNNDNECFKWAVTEAVYPQKRDRERITKISKENAMLFNWEGIKFPMKESKIGKFEKNNPKYIVNVLGYSTDDGVHPVRISKHYTSDTTDKTIVNLLIISSENQRHYVLINNMSRLVGMQTNKHKTKTHICLNCFNTFSLEKSFKEHTEFCLNNEAVKIDMPTKGTTIKFNKFGKASKVPFIIYADFESYMEKVSFDGVYDDQQSYTKKYQKHTPSGFCYYIVYRGEIYRKPIVYTGENIAEEFCKHLKIETQEIYDNYFKKIVPIRMTRDDLNKYERMDVCHICEETINNDDFKVKDHNHFTGEFVGAAHQSCNLKFKEPSFIPVVFHNLSGYDAHLFIKQLGVEEGKIIV